MLKLLKRFLLFLLLLLTLAGLIPVLFPGLMTSTVIRWANANINGKLNFTKTRISLIRNFPQLTLSIHEFSLTGAPPFAADTLFAGKELSFGIDLLSLFRKKMTINGVYLDQGRINILTDTEGRSNYQILKTTKSDQAEKSSRDAELKISEVVVSGTNLLYHDQSVPVRLAALDLNYNGEADVNSELYDLTTQLQIKKLDLAINDTRYLQNKSLRAEMITRINTGKLSFEFKKNKLSINDLPVDFSGLLRFISDGYDIDLALVSGTTDLKNVFSVLPPAYGAWASKTTILGTSRITLNMKGAYSKPRGLSPDLRVGVLLQKGSIRHAGAPFALENVELDATLDLPSLNADRVGLDLRNFSWLLGGDKGKATLQLKKEPRLFLTADVDSRINLDLLKKALGLDQYRISGMLYSKVLCSGYFEPAKKIFPAGNATLHVTDGSFTAPEFIWPLTAILLKGDARCPDGKAGSLSVSLNPLQFKLGNDPLSVNARLHNLDNIHYDVHAEGKIDCAKLKPYLPKDELSVNGVLSGKLQFKGSVADAKALRYQNLYNSGKLNIRNMRVKSSFYPDSFLIADGLFTFNDDDAHLQDVRLHYRKNRLNISGNASRYFGWLLNKDVLRLRGDVQATVLNLNDFMAYDAAPSKKTASQPASNPTVVQVPDRFDFKLHSQFGEVDYKDMVLKDFTGEAHLSESRLALDTARFRVAGAVFGLSGNYKALNTRSAEFGLRVKADTFNISRAYAEIPLFRELASSASMAKGTVSMQYAVRGKLNASMMPDYPTLRGGGWVKLEDVSVKGMKLFNEVGRMTGRDSVANPRLKAVLIKSSIANNRIKIERTKMRIRSFRPRLEGYVYFDNRLDLRMRLGLPPFGIIGIPLTIKGTSEKPKIKMKKEQLDPEEEEKE